jgi:small subunit ribosomal protein S6
MPFYETTFIARPDLSSQQAEGLAERFAGLVTENGGAVAKTEHWGLKSLAYHIKKHRKGHYVMFGLDAPPATVKELERSMRIDEDVLRFLTVRVDKIDPEPSAPIQSRGAREDRPRGDRGDRSRGERSEREDRPRGERGEREGRPRGERDERGAREARGDREEAPKQESAATPSEEEGAKTDVKGETHGNEADLKETET